MSTPVSPAQVRYVLERKCQTATIEGNILRDHIRAVAAEMRERARCVAGAAECINHIDAGALLRDHARELSEYADKLEGVE